MDTHRLQNAGVTVAVIIAAITIVAVFCPSTYESSGRANWTENTDRENFEHEPLGGQLFSELHPICHFP
jgi:hypothetical protein